MKLTQILNGIQTHTPILTDVEISGIAYDSRRVTAGCLFVCVKGYQTDGHRYIQNAVAAGAAAVLVQDMPETPPEIPCYATADTRRALAQAAANFYDHPEEKLIPVAVTGTNGKTTVTTLIKAVLEAQGKQVGLIGTNANMIGDRILPTERTTPESLELFALFAEMVAAGMEYVVMEVSSHSLYLDRVYGIRFAVGVFTNLTQDHLDFHKTMENYFEAKKLLFHNCNIGVANADDPYGRRILDEKLCPMMSFAVDGTADFVASDLQFSPRGVSFSVTHAEHSFAASLGIPGRFSVYNALAAIAACTALGVPMSNVLAALATAQGVKGRAEIVHTDTDYTLIIDYAHTPDGLENIIKTVKGFAQGRVVTLFGCGGDRDPIKRPIMGRLAGELSDYCIITSDNPRTEDPIAIIRQIEAGMKETACAYTVIENRREAIGYAMQNAQPGDCIILAGKGHETYQIIGTEKRHFDEREVIYELLSGMR